MRRRLFTFLPILSLLLFVATCVLWVRSYLLGDRLVWERAEQNTWEQFSLFQRRGHVGAVWLRLSRSGPDLTIDDQFDGRTRFNHNSSVDEWSLATAHEARSLWNSLGFYYYSPGLVETLSAGEETIEHVHVTIPHWFPAALTAILPAVWLMRLRRRRRLARVGRCPNCGYDLRASPDRCPECGRAAAGATASSAGSARPT